MGRQNDALSLSTLHISYNLVSTNNQNYFISSAFGNKINQKQNDLFESRWFFYLMLDSAALSTCFGQIFSKG